MGGREGEREEDWEERGKNACSKHPSFLREMPNAYHVLKPVWCLFSLLVVTNVHTPRVLNQAPIG